MILARVRALTTLAVALIASGCGGASRAKPEPPLVVTRCCYDGTEHIYSVAGDGATRLITAGSVPKWSPDHHSLVFLRSDSAPGLPANQDAWLVQPANGVERRLTFVRPPNQVRFLAFDGKPAVIAYDDHSGIWVMPPDGTAPSRVLADGSANSLAVSRDGSTIAYARNDTDQSRAGLYTVGVADHVRHVVFPGNAHTCDVSSPGWSADDRWIVFALCIDKGGMKQVPGIWLIHPDGSELHRIATGTNPAWSPDGRWIAFITSKENAARNDQLSAVARVTPDGKRQIQITPYATGSAAGATNDELDW
jgi:Tol biopolymer transport system component